MMIFECRGCDKTHVARSKPEKRWEEAERFMKQHASCDAPAFVISNQPRTAKDDA